MRQGNGVRQEWIEAHESFGSLLRASLPVAERGEADGCSVDERLVQCIWHDAMFRQEALTTASGKRLEVLDSGRWNTSRGPDFQNVRLRLAGEELNGAVEIHVHSSGWRAHGHHQDFEYNPVVLHVCLHASDDRPYEEKQNGERLERLVLDSILDPDLETIRRTINVNDYPHGRPAHLGVCHEQFIRLPEKQVRQFFERAGRARIEEKVARYEAQLSSASVPQLVYQSLMVGQGFKANKTLYFLLSKRAPYEELLDYASDVPDGERSDMVLSILLHVAQLVPAQPDFFAGADEETARFTERLERHWRSVRGYFSDRLMPPTKRWYSGMRPPGFPGRRLAAVSHLLARLADPQMPLFAHLCRLTEALPASEMAPKDWKRFFGETAALLAVDVGGHYFETHYTLGGKPCRPQALLGEPTARALLFNVVLPLAILHGRKERNAVLVRNAWEAVARYPSLPANSVTELMRRRLFGESGFDKGLFRTEVMHQALLKVFHDCCSLNERTCADCTFLNPPFRPVQ